MPPTYELALLLRNMPKPEVASTLKRIALCIFDRDGSIRAIENLGLRELPFRIRAHGDVQHSHALHFLMKFDAPPLTIVDLMREYSLDVDVVRRRIYRILEQDHKGCTLEKEMQPPAYRKEVKEMIQQNKRQEAHSFTFKFKYNSGLKYYPFNK